MKQSKYTAKQPDAQGYINYSAQEDAVWAELYQRQWPIIQNRACDAYLRGLELLELSTHKVPQCAEVSSRLREFTGWQVVPVAALISFEEFFALLAEKKFPAASFIRTREDMDYLPEPDIFHEIFGHCPLLTDTTYANFMHEYGKIGHGASAKDKVYLARLFWFTIEFGLLQQANKLSIYGAGILSSQEETIYALESDVPLRKPFEIIDVLRTPYRYDIKQQTYFVIQSFDELYQLTQHDLLGIIAEVKPLGLYPAQHAGEAASDKLKGC
jgi:phenylalanine-4-hydroxylase